MTEQEKRETAIYIMVIDAYGHLLESPSYYEIVKDIRSGRYGELERLYDAGFRKEEEVRKGAVWEFYLCAYRFADGRTKKVSIEDLKEVARKVFGVEVEE